MGARLDIDKIVHSITIEPGDVSASTYIAAVASVKHLTLSGEQAPGYLSRATMRNLSGDALSTSD